MLTFDKFVKSAAVMALLAGGAFATSDVTSTKHNLSATGTGTIKASSGQNNDEICVYCHTPHASNTDFIGAPLWNKATPGGSFTMYGTTIAGTATASAPSSPSMACLSCHDGVSAINSIVNAPGSGGYNAAGANVAFGTTTAGTAFVMPTTTVANLGTELRNDHPVSIDYVVDRAGLKATDTTLTGWAGATTIANLLRSNKVECGSCHDPHEATNGTFLRVSNAGSALCIGCHAK